MLDRDCVNGINAQRFDVALDRRQQSNDRVGIQCPMSGLV